MTKSATGKIPAFKRALTKELKAFESFMKIAGFKKIPIKEKIEFLFGDKKKPKRATPENILQDEYLYVSGTGYKVKIITGMKGRKFIDSGAGWLHIINKKDELVMSQLFNRNYGHALLSRLRSNANIFRMIADSKPHGMDLFRVIKDKPAGKRERGAIEAKYEWRSRNGKVKPLDILSFIEKLNKKDAANVRSLYKASVRYLENSKGVIKQRREERRLKTSTWK